MAKTKNNRNSGVEHDDVLDAVREVLLAYQRDHESSRADAFRENPAVIRVRVIDRRFEGMTRSRRHDAVFRRLAKRLGDDVAEIYELLALAPSEENNFANLLFEGDAAKAV